jgi:hypothetical protein
MIPPAITIPFVIICGGVFIALVLMQMILNNFRR